jgi:hypothetical protein
MTWNRSQTIVIGLISNQFHKFWWFQVFCRICLKYTQMEHMQRRDWDGIQISITTNNLKCHIWPYHVEVLIETHKIKFWFTQFGVRTTKLRLLEDRETGQAETGEEGRQATPNYAQTLSNFVQSIFTHYRAQGKVGLHKWRPYGHRPTWPVSLVTSTNFQHAAMHLRWSQASIPSRFYGGFIQWWPRNVMQIANMALE